MTQKIKLLLLLIAAIIATQSAKAGFVTDDGIKLTYQVNANHPDDAEVTGYEGAAPVGTLEIPETLDGKTVTTIFDGYMDESAVMGSFSNCTEITDVVLPESVTYIGQYAFYSCTNLGSINLPDDITTISDKAFYACRGLESVDLPANLTTIGSYAFNNCSSITEIDIPVGVNTIGSNVFKGCSDLETVTLNWTSPETILNVTGSEIFNSSPIIYVPAGCKQLYEDRGWGAYGTVTEIGSTPPTTAVIDGLIFSANADGTTASVTGYEGAKPTGELVIPATVAIGGVPYNVTAIDNNASAAANGVFFQCQGITSVVLPDGLETIGKYVFQQCIKIASVNFPSTLTKIDNNAFYKCLALTTLDIPSSVTSLGTNPFGACEGLTEVTLNWDADKIPTVTNVFGGIEKTNVTLYVPAGYVDDYKATSWIKAATCFGVITEFGDLVIEANTTGKLYDYAKYNTITLNPGAEVNATGVTGMTVQAVEVIKTFSYSVNTTKATKEWFSLGLPFEVAAGNNQIWKLEDDGTYVVAEQNTDFATFDYNGERRLSVGADGGNWVIYLADNGNIGEVIQFPKLGTYTYKFVSADSDAALDALMNGRDGNKFFDTTTSKVADNGWNVVPAGKTYSTSYTDKIAGVKIAQVFDGTTGYFKTGEMDATYAPGTVFSIQLTAESTGYINTNSESDAEVETYGFKLIDSEGNVIDRIYLFDGSNQAQYRVGKMGAFSATAPQMCIQANGKNYCAYSSLTSDTDKSYTVSLANVPEGSQLVMTQAGAQSVTVDDTATTLDAAIDVANGNINITIGSQTTSVGDAAAAAKVYGADDAIIIEGANGAYSVINMSGVAVATGMVEGNAAINLPAGIYVVNAADEYSKVIVK